MMSETPTPKWTHIVIFRKNYKIFLIPHIHKVPVGDLRGDHYQHGQMPCDGAVYLSPRLIPKTTEANPAMAMSRVLDRTVLFTIPMAFSCSLRAS